MLDLLTKLSWIACCCIPCCPPSGVVVGVVDSRSAKAVGLFSPSFCWVERKLQVASPSLSVPLVTLILMLLSIWSWAVISMCTPSL